MVEKEEKLGGKEDQGSTGAETGGGRVGGEGRPEGRGIRME